MRYAIIIVFLFFLSLRTKGMPGDFFSNNYLLQNQLAKGLVFDILQDRTGMMWFGTEFGLLQYDGYQIKTFKHQPLDPTTISDNVVTSITEDDAGNLWVGTMFGGLNYLDRRFNTFVRYNHDPKNTCTISGNRINDIVITREQLIYISVEGGGINIFNPLSGCFKHFREPELPTSYTESMLAEKDGNILIGHYFGVDKHKPGTSNFTSLPFFKDSTHPIVKAQVRDAKQTLWLGTRENGLYFISPSTGKTTPVNEFTLSTNHRKRHIWQIYPTDEGNMWIATDEGLYVLQSEKDSWLISRMDLGQANRALAIYKSKDGVFWIGTNNGILVLSPRLKKFNLHPVKLAAIKEGSIRGVNCINPARDGQLWIGTNDGLFKYDVDTRTFNQDFQREYPAMSFLCNNNNIMAVHEFSDGQIWISTIKGFNSGFSVYKLDNKTNTIINYTQRCEPFKQHVTFQITMDHHGHLWFANGMGLIKYQPELDSIRVYMHNPRDSNSIGSNFINRVYFSSKRELWIGTNDAGLDEYDFNNDSFRHRPADITSEKYLSHGRILHITENKRQQLIVATAGGLNILDANRQIINRYFGKDGLKDEVINGVLGLDEQLWMTSPQTLTCYHFETRRFIHYDQQDGLNYQEFWDRTAARDKNGRLYFGTDQGLLEFLPEEIIINTDTPSVVFTELLVFNQVIHPTLKNALLPSAIYQQPKITFKYRQNVFSVQFRALSYIRPDKIHYMAKLDGFEEDWQDLKTRNEITYTNLNPGKYVLRVKASNSDGVWNEDGNMLHLEVLAPWWKSKLAIFLYVLLTGLLARWIYVFQLNKHLAILEHQRLIELNRFKSNFFTNMTHEFRTPLTLILGIIDQALKSSKPLTNVDFQMVKNQAMKLLHLINDILDISKIEAGKLDITKEPFDLIKFLKYLTESFHPAAKEKNIVVNFISDKESLVIVADEKKIGTIYTNLLSNALKFSYPGEMITVEIRAVHDTNRKTRIINSVCIAVTDKGPGIAPEHLSSVFDRFYITNTNRNEGTGIGLALAKELTILMGGHLTVESYPHEKTTFTIHLPVEISDEQAKSKMWTNFWEEAATSIVLSKSSQKADYAAPIVLIVEDNEDVMNFMGSILTPEYQTIYAKDGEEGMKKAIESIPDIILSDVMMPNVNGYELLNRIKKEERTSHIPVILITARADSESKLIGLKLHADAYISKPFDTAELRLIIGNLLLNQKKLKDKYMQMAKTNIWDDPVKYPEHVFLRKVRSICERELSNPIFSIEDLCLALNISHAQAHRKMVALTGHSLQIFFKLLRLGRAKELLNTSDFNISEIAYATGFDDPAYFAKVFKKEYGKSPSAWRNESNTD